jgi:hypothetical protein
VDWVRRLDKGKAVTRYISTRTGIPTLYFDASNNQIDSPPPYRFAVSTDASWCRLGSYLKNLPEDSISAAVRYDKFVEGGIDNAVVAMRLSTFVQLVECHYNTIQDRIETYIKGD